MRFCVFVCFFFSCSSPTDDAIAEVARVHGGAGPWAVSGHRMGTFALRELGLSRGSFDVVVEHRAPQLVQYTCIADGAQAATGASLGKLNLTMVEVASPDDVTTTFRHKQTKQELTLRLTPAFRARYLDVPREQLWAKGREVMELRDDDIFERVP